MGYTICYDRAFIRAEDKILPIALAGSSNCYDVLPGGREVREREWCVFGNDDMLCLSADELMTRVEQIHQDHGRQAFKWRSQWLNGKQAIAWYRAGIKAARPIEDWLHKNKYISFKCAIISWDKQNPCKNIPYLETRVCTTEELVAWLAAAQVKGAELAAKQDVGFFCHLGFTSRKPLVKPDTTGDVPVVVKHGRQFVVAYQTGKSIGYDINSRAAIVFQNAEDAWQKIGHDWGSLRAIKADTRARPYVIQSGAGCYAGQYIERQTRGFLRFCRSVKSAMRFVTEASAQKYIQKLRAKYPEAKTGECVVVKEEENE